jgi:cytochrome c oxidase assembly protein subunit 15
VKRLVSTLQRWARAFYYRLPTAIERRVRVFAWLSLAIQLLIVLTGGAVRLTDSGLGCPTWPQCTEGSFVTTPEMGIHGVIEFGNRLLFFVIQIVAIITFLLIVRLRRERRDLFVLALIPCFSIVLQAVLGGITVLTNLNPYVVGLHFLASVVLVALATVFVYRAYYGPRSSVHAAPPVFRVLAYLASAAVLVTVLLGIVTTGSGPHAGDGGAARNGLDSELLQHLHSWPAYVAFGLSVLLFLGASRLRVRRLVRFTSLLVFVEVLQIMIGITQARLGLPEVLVAIHMVLACMLAAAMTAVLLSLRGQSRIVVEQSAAAQPTS